MNAKLKKLLPGIDVARKNRNVRLFGLTLCMAALGCTPCHCLSGSLGRFAGMAELQLVQREFERAQSSSPSMRARILGALPALFPDLSNQSDAPRCSPELLEVLRDELEELPLPYNDATLYYLKALGAVGDTTDVMPRKAIVLLQLARLPDAQISPYEMTSGERGTPPAKRHIRDLATAELAHSNLYLNDARVREYLVQQALFTQETRVELLVFDSLSELTWKPPPQTKREALTDKWLTDVQAAIDAPADEMRFELVLRQVRLLGAIADSDGASRRFDAVLSRIIDADGTLPITRGNEAWARDLTIWARDARRDLEDTTRNFLYQTQLPYPARKETDVSGWVFDAPTEMSWPDAELTERIRQLDDEIENAGSPAVQCRLLEQRNEWTPNAERRGWYERLLRDSESSGCGFYLALDSDAVAEATITRLIADAVREDPYGRSIRTRLAGSSSPADAARFVLSTHLHWIRNDPKLRETVFFDALGEQPDYLWSGGNTIDSIDHEKCRLAYQRAIHTAVEQDAVGPLNRQQLAREVVAHWIEMVPILFEHTFSGVYAYDLRTALLYSVAELAPRLGLSKQARPLIEGDDYEHTLAAGCFAAPGASQFHSQHLFLIAQPTS